MHKKVMAKKEALKKLKSIMSGLGGKSYENGISAKVVADDPKSLAEGLEVASELMEGAAEEPDYENMSREELIKCLKEKM